MKTSELKKLWIAEENENFVGWDFSKLSHRITWEPLPWNYEDIVHHHLTDTMSLLDMGTGGGEFLLSLMHPYENTSVTESYPPNIELCMKELKPLGITVYPLNEGEALPIEDHSFDIVINRHESYDSNEVFRILKPGGMFITQQVGPFNNRVLSRFLLNDPAFTLDFDNALDRDKESLISAGFDVVRSEEYFPISQFLDTGALVQFAKIIEWEFPGFSVETCFDQLCQIHDHIEKNGSYKSEQHRYIIVCRK